MHDYQFLQLQPIDPQDDGVTSDLDEYSEDETIDLTQETDEATLDHAWEQVMNAMHTDDDSLGS